MKKKIYIDPDYYFLNDFIEQIDVEIKDSGESIYTGRNVLKRYTVGEMDIIVKSFRIPIWINRVVYTFFRSSKAESSFRNASILLEKNFQSPYPIAYILNFRSGLLAESYYLSLESKDVKNVGDFLMGDSENEAFQEAFSHFVADVQQAGVWHEDLSPGNILVREQGEEYTFSIVDTNRMKFCSISDKKRLQNFIRLFPRRKGSTMFARYYARYRELDEELTVVRINAICDHFFGRKVVRWSKAKVRKTEGWWHSICGPIQHYQLLRFVRRLLQLPESSSITQKERKLYDSYIVGSDPRELFKP